MNKKKFRNNLVDTLTREKLVHNTQSGPRNISTGENQMTQTIINSLDLL